MTDSRRPALTDPSRHDPGPPLPSRTTFRPDCPSSRLPRRKTRQNHAPPRPKRSPSRPPDGFHPSNPIFCTHRLCTLPRKNTNFALKNKKWSPSMPPDTGLRLPFTAPFRTSAVAFFLCCLRRQRFQLKLVPPRSPNPPLLPVKLRSPLQTNEAKSAGTAPIPYSLFPTPYSQITLLHHILQRFALHIPPQLPGRRRHRPRPELRARSPDMRRNHQVRAAP